MSVSKLLEITKLVKLLVKMYHTTFEFCFIATVWHLQQFSSYEFYDSTFLTSSESNVSGYDQVGI